MMRYLFSTAIILFAIGGVYAAEIADPGNADLIVIDSVQIAAGKSAAVSIRVLADDTTHFNNKTWRGVGSMCIPLKYDKSAIKVDSAKFRGNVAAWDEKFVNAKIDTGFISLAGIYNIAGEENAPLYSSDKPEEIAELFITASPDAKAGTYKLQLTADPIQKELYFGSIDGFHSWKPTFQGGIIIVK